MPKLPLRCRKPGWVAHSPGSPSVAGKTLNRFAVGLVASVPAGEGLNLPGQVAGC